MSDIVYLTVGSSNSSVITRMIAALGWHLGDVPASGPRAEFAEHDGVHWINRAVTRGRRPFDAKRAAAVLAALPRPWCLKDPKFCETLAHWRPLFGPYRPLLLWVTKDPAYVRASYARRWPGEFAAAYADKRLAMCQRHFAAWPWAKLKLDVDQIAAAVSLFDPARSARHAVTPPP
jgi:hypothetical protein